MAATAAENAAVLSACPHFSVCGGCIDLLPKDDIVPQALRRAGFLAPDIAEIVISPPRTRRRMDLAARRSASGVEMGLHRHRSHDIVDLHHCEVLHPDLVALFDPLRAVLNRSDLLRRSASVIANRLDNGVDILLRSDNAASPHDRTRLADFAQSCGITRVSHAIGPAAPETLAGLHTPSLCFSGVTVCPPPGGFLQATAAGEAAIIAAVIAGLPKKLRRREKIAELYAGSGTLTFALEKHARVDAYEGDAAAHAAMDRACRNAGLLGRITPALRDLVRQPLMPQDLKTYACIVLDPPAAGAPVQITHIAASTLRHIIYVSCDPAALARDTATLRQAGFALLKAQPIDQFIGTPRVECVCVLGR